MNARMERSAKKIAKSFVLATAIALAVSNVAWARDDDDDDAKACGNSTLHGLYLFTASGFNISGVGIAQPKAIVEVIRFHGDGTLTVPAATVSINGTVTRPNPPNGTGTYSIGPDCTGSLSFTQGPSFDLFVEFKGSEIQMIQTNPNTVFRGTAERVSR
jgi:hypothetical protein